MHTLENTTETEMVGIWNGTGSQGPRQRQRRCRLYSVDMNIGLDHLKLWWIILLYGFLSVVTRAQCFYTFLRYYNCLLQTLGSLSTAAENRSGITECIWFFWHFMWRPFLCLLDGPLPMQGSSSVADAKNMRLWIILYDPTLHGDRLYYLVSKTQLSCT